MSVFYMKKTGKNGKVATKVATEEAEMEYDKKLGWVEFDPDEKPADTLTLPKKPEAQPAKGL